VGKVSRRLTVRAEAQQKSASLFEGLFNVLSYGAVVFGVLGGLTLINPALGQIAAVCSLIAAGLAGAIKVQDLDKRQAAHYERAAKYQKLADETDRILEAMEKGAEPPAGKYDKLLAKREELDLIGPRAPSRIYDQVKDNVAHRRAATDRRGYDLSACAARSAARREVAGWTEKAS